MTKRLFVGDISYDTRAPALQAAFAACGEIADIEIVTAADSRRPRGSAIGALVRSAAR
jgi:hypothetical protein